jgi:hypothetical protein
MAAADYRLCDVCNGKAFYDSDLSYEFGPSEYRDTPPFRVYGEPQYPDAAMNAKHGMRLGYLGDWAVICEDCAPNWRTSIDPMPINGDAEYESWHVAALPSDTAPKGMP